MARNRHAAVVGLCPLLGHQQKSHLRASGQLLTLNGNCFTSPAPTGSLVQLRSGCCRECSKKPMRVSARKRFRWGNWRPTRFSISRPRAGQQIRVCEFKIAGVLSTRILCRLPMLERGLPLLPFRKPLRAEKYHERWHDGPRLCFVYWASARFPVKNGSNCEVHFFGFLQSGCYQITRAALQPHVCLGEKLYDESKNCQCRARCCDRAFEHGGVCTRQ